MIHCISLKAVESLQLFKPSDIMQQCDQLRKFHIFCLKPHPPSDLLTAPDHTIGMYDLQLYFIILTVISIQIFLKYRLHMFKIHDLPHILPDFLLPIQPLPFHPSSGHFTIR